jgi:hypothetical protein
MLSWLRGDSSHEYAPVRSSSSRAHDDDVRSSVAGTSEFTTLHIDNRAVLARAREETAALEEEEERPGPFEQAKAASTRALNQVKDLLGESSVLFELANARPLFG